MLSSLTHWQVDLKQDAEAQGRRDAEKNTGTLA